MMLDIFYGGNGFINDEIEFGTKTVNCYIYYDKDKQAILVKNQTFLQAKSSGGVQTMTDTSSTMSSRTYKL